MVLILHVFRQTLFGNYINLILIFVDDEICLKFSSQDSGQKKRVGWVEVLLNSGEVVFYERLLSLPFIYVFIINGSIYEVAKNYVSRDSRSKMIHHSWELHMLLFLFFILARKMLCYL